MDYIYIISLNLLMYLTVVGFFFWRFGNTVSTNAIIYVIPVTMSVGLCAFTIGKEGMTLKLMLIAVPLAVIFAISGLGLLYLNVIRPLAPLSEQLQAMAEQNALSVTTKDSTRTDEIGTIQRATTNVAVQLNELLGEFQYGIQSLAASIQKIITTTQQSAATAAEQSSTITEMSVTVDEIYKTSQTAAENAAQVETAAQKAFISSNESLSQLDATLEFINSVYESIDHIQHLIEKLQDKNENIVTILEDVNDFAQQSNMLVVNASIEAARAGEEGRGFSVVANEVRNLAEQSNQATRQIKSIIDTITSTSRAAFQATDEANYSMQIGRESLREARLLMEQLSQVLKQNEKMAIEISEVSQQQSEGVQLVAATMEELSKGSQMTATNTLELEKSVEGLKEVGNHLQENIKEYDI